MSSFNIKNLQPNERRKKRRMNLSGLMPGRLANKETEKLISCRPINVSVKGLGIVSTDLLNEGTIVVLSIKSRKIEFRVVWSQQDFKKQNMTRYGLQVLDENINIEEVFRDSGMFI